MRVRISWDQGSTFVRECELVDCIQPKWDAATFAAASNELALVGRYWLQCGKYGPALLMVVR
jgi:hypothetical protein